MSRNDACICGSGKKQKHCHPDITPDSRAGKILALYAEIDALQHHSADTPPCTIGCVQCCSHWFYIYGIEHKLIERELQKWSEEKLQALWQKLEHQIKNIQSNYPHLWRNLEAEGTGNAQILNDQIFKAPKNLRIPCPFLNSSSRSCEIYSVRPAICRLHGTTFYNANEHAVCDLIPSNFENRNRVPNAIAVFKKLIAYTNPRVSDDFYIRLRPYPLLYWLHLTHQNNLTGIAIPNEGRDFRLPTETADRIEFAVIRKR